jgi:hypothetical protein
MSLALKHINSPTKIRIKLKERLKVEAIDRMDFLRNILTELQFPNRFLEQKIQSELTLKYQNKNCLS